MPVSVSELNHVGTSQGSNDQQAECESLEYHALMGVRGGDEPQIHARSFERSASAPISRVRGVMGRNKAESVLI